MLVKTGSAALLLAVIAVTAQTASAAEFTAAWPEGIERIWIGPEYYANRLQDWRVRDGRLECVEGSAAKPMRTVHLLTRALKEAPGTLSMSVRSGAIEPGKEKHSDTWTGFLIGAGGMHVDYRISALCHHWTSADGGLVAAVDGTGRAVFRDNSTTGMPRSLSKPIPLDTWKPLADVTSEGEGFGDRAPESVLIELEAAPDGDAYVLTLTVRDGASGDLLSRAVARNVDPEHLSGSVALVSHRSPKLKGPGYWFKDWRAGGSKLVAFEERALGPVIAAQHTLSRGILKMTAQMGPLGAQDTQEAELQIKAREDWETVAAGTLIEHSFTIPFRVEGWDADRDVPYRIAYDLRTGPDSKLPTYYTGTIRRPPADAESFVVAAFTGHHISTQGKGEWNHDGFWFPHNELVAAVRAHEPDLLFFSGDQIYESGLAGIVRNPPGTAAVDYLYHWYNWCWAFGGLARDIPCICIPDDHDVYHGNVWGAGGRKAARIDDGGYLMDPLFVNAVQQTQTSHLPDPFDPTPVEQGIGVYYTAVDYAGLSFAVIEDRKWKSSPTVMVPEGKVVNGWFQNPDFDPAVDADVPGAVLLGERQLEFLEHWAGDWSGGTWMKVLLSQTIFANVATLPAEAAGDGVVPRLVIPGPGEYIEGDKLAADADSNGWPQAGRNRALRAIRRGFAFHIAGDQHLASFVHYGVDDWNDAPYALCVPSIANLWPRRWFPPEPGKNRKPGEPAYTGEFLDGFGNRITVRAVANPRITGREPSALYDRAPGYGIVRFHRQTRDITAEVWPRWEDPRREGAEPYEGWPVTVNQLENYGREARAFLPTILVRGMADPVIQVVDEKNNELVYTIRASGKIFRPMVFEPGVYTVRVGEPGTPRMKTLASVQSVAAMASDMIEIDF